MKNLLNSALVGGAGGLVSFGEVESFSQAITKIITNKVAMVSNFMLNPRIVFFREMSPCVK